MPDTLLHRLITPDAPPVPVLVQGATGRVARRHIVAMRAHGTELVAGVTSRPDQQVDGLPLFPDCAAAVAATGAVASLIMVPPLRVLAAAKEALAAGIGLIVTVTEGIPLHDTLQIWHAVREAGADWVGASSPGLAVPGRCKLGFLPDSAIAPGPIALWSKSGTLSYETASRLKARGLGQSAWIGVGGDPVKGTRFADLLPLFRAHAPTRAILIVGEIGGTEEEDLATALEACTRAGTPFPKPVYAILAGATAPPGVTMGHAGAIVEAGRGTFASKADALRGAGALVFDAIAPLVERIATDLAPFAVRKETP